MIKKLLIENETDRYDRNKIIATYKSVEIQNTCLNLQSNHKNLHKLLYYILRDLN